MVTRRLLGVLLATLGCSLALAASPQSGWNEAYAEKTEALGLRGDLVRGKGAFIVCRGCHRADALGREDGSYPRLAGQHATVLIKQLTDVRSGRRSNPKMLPFADHHEISVQGVADIAAYLQALPVPANQGQGPGKHLTRGRQIYEADCATCHGARGEGNAEKFYPRVSGQHYRYLLREARMIRDGMRHNANPDMIKAIRKYSNAKIAAVSDYMSRLAVDRP